MTSDTAKIHIPFDTLENHLHCSICLSVIRGAVLTPCGHRFCRKCITEWVGRNPTCPCCKSTLYASQLYFDVQFDSLTDEMLLEKDKAGQAHFDRMFSQASKVKMTTHEEDADQFRRRVNRKFTQKMSYGFDIASSVKMTTHEDDGDLFRRRVQQEMAEQMSYGFDIDPSDSFLNREETEGQSSKNQSPYCIENFLWLAGAVAVFYFSDFIKVIVYDLRIKSTWYWIGVLAMGIHIGIVTFLLVYLNCWKKISSNIWDRKYPNAVPIATAAFIIGLICLSVGLWPVWGLFAPVILLILFRGAVVVNAMVG